MSGPAIQTPSTNLQVIRLLVGITPRELARRARVSHRTINACESGHVPKLETQIAIAHALDRAIGTQPLDVPRPLRHLDLWPLCGETAA